MTVTVIEGGMLLLLLPGDGSSRGKEVPRNNMGSMYVQSNQPLTWDLGVPAFIHFTGMRDERVDHVSGSCF